MDWNLYRTNTRYQPTECFMRFTQRVVLIYEFSLVFKSFPYESFHAMIYWIKMANLMKTTARHVMCSERK